MLGQFIYIHEMPDPPPLEKPGYNLIWHDEFDGSDLNELYWNKSSVNDDYYINCERDITLNPANVSVSDGTLKLEINTTDFDGCDNSGAEVKTFSVTDGNFHDYYFQAPCYIEIRAFGLPFTEGLGSAAWVYNCDAPQYSEIDIWETDGKNKNRFQTNYWWQDGPYVSGCTLVGGEVRQDDPKVCKLKNLDDPYLWVFYKNFDLTQQWINFGVEWSATHIRYYINNILCNEIDLSEPTPEENTYDRPTGNLTLRLGVANNPIGDKSDMFSISELPKKLVVDYVRAYTPESSKAGDISIYPESICTNNGAVVAANFLPGVNYYFTSWAFDILPTANIYPNERWIELKSGLPYNQAYPITLHTVFPNGYMETSIRSIFIDSGLPVEPAETILTEQINSLCEFYALYPIEHKHVIVYWSMSGVDAWQEAENIQVGGQWYSQFQNTFLPETEYELFIQTENGCGVSVVSDPLTFTTPSVPEGCWWRQNDLSNFTTDSIADFTRNDCAISFSTGLENLYVSTEYPGVKWHLSIIDITGRVVATRMFETKSAEVNFSHLPAGIYFARILSTEINCIQVTRIYIS